VTVRTSRCAERVSGPERFKAQKRSTRSMPIRGGLLFTDDQTGCGGGDGHGAGSGADDDGLSRSRLVSNRVGDGNARVTFRRLPANHIGAVVCRASAQALIDRSKLGLAPWDVMKKRGI